MLRKIITQIIIIFSLICSHELGKADHCGICLVDECYATYQTEPDDDADGMNDNLEMQLAIQFKPVLDLEKRLDNLALKQYILTGYE